jgi:alanyl-tRNA synthetase
MSTLTSGEIRQQFLDFFAGKGHTVVPSASLIPYNDPTLLFTNAGMNQFKDVFLSIGTRPYTRAVDTQKCMRVSGKHNDLEDVGKSLYHHTFFEMLGNWSFGDYYKKEAVQWAWELLTEQWKLPGERLYATVFEDDQGDLGRDDEAADYWTQMTTINPAHILSFGGKDNFWEMGETGPCGPCSEIHFDRGPEFCNLQGAPGHVCRVNGDCQRIVELWNLVFIQYNRRADGTLEPLPARHVDTGAGFERLVAVLQGVRSNYETDLFTGLLARTQQLLGHSDRQREQNRVAYRVVADHTRAAAFLIADGALPGNLGRNYVLRMIIRRAARFGKQLGFTNPFLAQIAAVVIEEMGAFFTELQERRQHILTTLTAEEQRFQRTLDTALAELDDLLAELEARDGRTISGETAFDLYATFGLPLEITRDVAQERGFAVDEPGFKAAAEEHKRASGGGAIGTIDADKLGHYAELLDLLVAHDALPADGVDQDPYAGLSVDTRLVALLLDGRPVDAAQPGQHVAAVVASTPFYVESGGQVSDTGFIHGPDGWQIRVNDAQTPLPGLVLHLGEVIHGSPTVGDAATVAVDADRRWDIMRNHTATHLLHRELRHVLGTHVLQQGSLVAPDRLRFDFNHPTVVRESELASIERRVNLALLRNYRVTPGHTSLRDAKDRGAMALFGEKYGQVVRTIEIAQPAAAAADASSERYSLELCGGTHVNETAEIGLFHILHESSVGANLRRIEAVTGRRAHELVQERMEILDRAASYLSAGPDELDRRVTALLHEVQSAQKEVLRLQRALARGTFLHLMETNLTEVAGVPVLVGVIQEIDVDLLREMVDWFRDRVGSGVAAFGTTADDRPVLIVAVTPDLVERGLNAGNLARDAAQLIGGGGGGKPVLAQAGGRDPSRLSEAVSRVQQLVAQTLGHPK